MGHYGGGYGDGGGQYGTYRDPIDQMGVDHAAVHPIDPAHGEDRVQGRTYQVGGWFGWSDSRRVAFMRGLVEQYGEDPKMRHFTARVLMESGVPPRDFKNQAAALLHFVQHAIYYTNEPGEQIQSPWATLKAKTGDCDDMAVLLATMLESIDVPWKFALAGKKDGKPIRWIEGEPWPWGVEMSHVYVIVGLPPGKPTVWHSAEPTVRGMAFGHDVVMNGLPRGTQGADIGGSTMGGYGGGYGNPFNPGAFMAPGTTLPYVQPLRWGDAPGAVGAGGVPGSVLTPGAPLQVVRVPSWLSWVDWPALGNEVLKAVVIAVAVGAVAVWQGKRNRGKAR